MDNMIQKYFFLSNSESLLDAKGIKSNFNYKSIASSKSDSIKINFGGMQREAEKEYDNGILLIKQLTLDSDTYTTPSETYICHKRKCIFT